jgi:sugar porter (SP) family MFS transporter
MTTAIVGEKLGRRKSVGLGALISIVGAVLQTTAYSRAHLIVGRIVSGFGLGIINSTVPVMQAEFSPKASRGIYVCAQLSTLNFGILLVYWIDYAFVKHTSSYAWRVPAVLQCVILIGILILLTLIPETPRWLAAHDHPEECLSVLARIADTSEADPEVQRLHSIITQNVAYENSRQAGWKEIVKSDRIKSRRRFLIACGIQMFQQLGGINAIIYYSGTLFEKSIGFDTHMSALMSGFLQTWFFVASFIPWFLIDRIGRRPLLMSMISLMAIVMAIQAALIYQVQFNTSSATGAGIAAAAMLFVFQGAFTVGCKYRTVLTLSIASEYEEMFSDSFSSSSNSLGISVRNSASATPATWIIHFYSSKLDLQLHYRADHASSD